MSKNKKYNEWLCTYLKLNFDVAYTNEDPFDAIYCHKRVISNIHFLKVSLLCYQGEMFDHGFHQTYNKFEVQYIYNIATL